MTEKKRSEQPSEPIRAKIDLSKYGWRTEPAKPSGSGFFADPHSVRVGVAELRKVDGLQVDAETWRKMRESERIGVLQAAEDRMAKTQGRTAERVFGKSMAENEYGYFQGGLRGRGIYVNTHRSKLDSLPESLNTVVHEGRHAYHDHAIRTPGFHPEKPGMPLHEEVREWRGNQGRNYQTIDEHGTTAYMTQPVEHDAGAYGFAVIQGLYPEYRPSQNRIDLYNADNARNRFGYLKTSAESQQVTSSDPARVDLRPQKATKQRKAAEPPAAASERKVALSDKPERTVKRQSVPGGSRREQGDAKRSEQVERATPEQAQGVAKRRNRKKVQSPSADTPKPQKAAKSPTPVQKPVQKKTRRPKI